MSSPAQARQLVLPELLRRNAFTSPGAPAISCNGVTRSFSELEERSARLAGALQDRVLPGQRVGLWLHNGLEIVEAIFAVHRLGAVAVPVNFRLAPDEVAFVLEDSGACGLIADHDLRAGAPTLPDRGWELTVGAGGTYEDAVREGPALDEPRPLDDDDAAFLIYTSGTTGRPKGAVLTHKNLVTNTANWIFEVGAARGDVYLFGFPLFHIGGLVGLYPFLHMGSLSVILPSGGFDGPATLDLIERTGTTIAAFVPAQWQVLVDLPDAAEMLRGVRRAIWGGSPASRPLLERMNEVLTPGSVASTFGQTEVTANATFLGPADSIAKLGSVGRPALTMEYRIVDDADRDVAPGDVGEIVYRGPTVMRGYHDRPDANAEAFRGGWFHSGDLVREDDDGYLYVVDRRNDMIISGGENIYPAEVERVLVQHARVREAAVFGVPDERWGETPMACIVISGDDGGPTTDELTDHCAERLARYKRPTRFAFVTELPRNPSGKVLKRVLREDFTDEQGAGHGTG